MGTGHLPGSTRIGEPGGWLFRLCQYYHVAGLVIVPCASVNVGGNWLAARCATSIWRKRVATWESFGLNWVGRLFRR